MTLCVHVIERRIVRPGVDLWVLEAIAYDFLSAKVELAKIKVTSNYKRVRAMTVVGSQ